MRNNKEAQENPAAQGSLENFSPKLQVGILPHFAQGSAGTPDKPFFELGEEKLPQDHVLLGRTNLKYHKRDLKSR